MSAPSPERPPRFERIVAIVPARGGSKGVPGKNIAPLAGRPLIAHTLLHIAACDRIARCVVTTDEARIAAVAREHGAQVVERPESLASDEASSESALVHALDALAAEGFEPDLVAFLQATSPLRRPGRLAEAIAELEASGADALFSASPVHGFVWRQEPAERPRALTYDPATRPRRQEIGEDWLENGSIYLFRPALLRRYGHRLGGRVAMLRQEAIEGFQIDEPGDLAWLEGLMGLVAAGRPPRDELAGIRLLALDFDGVLTDDLVRVDETGHEAVVCSRSDGLGLELLRRAGLEVVVISKERNPVVAARCAKLGLAMTQGVDDKLPVLQRIAADAGWSRHQVCFVGNDVNDVEAMTWSGLAITVADAHPAARAATAWRTGRAGGRGAVREVCDWILEARGHGA